MQISTNQGLQFKTVSDPVYLTPFISFTFTLLIDAGLLNRTENGGVEFPYEAVKVEFLLQAA